MHIGYARVSTRDRDAASQVAALKNAGCERIFKEKTSEGRCDRPELHRLLEHRARAVLAAVPATPVATLSAEAAP